MKKIIHVFRCPNCKARQRQSGRSMLCCCGFSIGAPRCCSYHCGGHPCLAVLVHNRPCDIQSHSVKFFCHKHVPLLAIGEVVTQEAPKFKKPGVRPVELGRKRHVSRERDGKTHS